MAFVDTEQRNAGEVQQKVGGLKLSEALRRGAALRPQCRNTFFNGIGTCALGAIAEARGWIPRAEKNSGVYEFVPEGRGNLGGEISVRNDDGESRESIAAWLESKGL